MSSTPIPVRRCGSTCSPTGRRSWRRRPRQLEAHRKLVREEIALFGSRHFAHYDYLLAISDNLSGIGLEHHQSSEDAVGLGYFSDWTGTAPGRDLLAARTGAFVERQVSQAGGPLDAELRGADAREPAVGL